MCVPVVKNLNVKVFNLMLKTNETRHIGQHEACKCKCRLDTSVCNNKQRWDDDKYRCESKELIDKGACDKEFIWNPRNCKCPSDKLCDVGEYLDYENFKCRKNIVDKLVKQCTETVEEVKIAKITLSADKNKYRCSSCAQYIVLFSITFTVNIGIGTCFVYWHLKRHVPCVEFEFEILVLKQQFIKFSFTKLIIGRSQTNRDQKSNLLFLQQHDQVDLLKKKMEIYTWFLMILLMKTKSY